MNSEKYIDKLSSDLLDLQEIIDNIKHSGLENDEKNRILNMLHKKYHAIHDVFKKEVLNYINY
tara:strand:+ start:4166 stop:4354 length:189 start_codon:yes stop_codon:yes gene_type:complete